MAPAIIRVLVLQVQTTTKSKTLKSKTNEMTLTLYSLQICVIVSSSVSISSKGCFIFTTSPPFSHFWIWIFGGAQFTRMPKPYSSFSIFCRTVQGLLLSSTMRMMEHVMATEMIWRPRPLPSLAPSMIPGVKNKKAVFSALQSALEDAAQAQSKRPKL